jgi:hypothetical protein
MFLPKYVDIDINVNIDTNSTNFLYDSKFDNEYKKEDVFSDKTINYEKKNFPDSDTLIN